MNSTQQIIIGLCIALCVIPFMLKEVSMVVEYDRTVVDAKRQKFIDSKSGIVDNNYLYMTAQQKYPYQGEEVGTDLMGFQIQGDYFKYKVYMSAGIVVLGILLCFIFKPRKKRMGY